ncbi:hypothetical protein MF628_002025 [Paenibacillus polymyxa]|uniref:hypothetical protein n=1 Tax=Paenibacillus polymyxa TaxID=1406 RepID=UPI002025AC3E|nr:hypothetical protein [Paenibacillus polymyxa]URJ47392.1 hypothetical protein MF628_002025 [Paenibacillus polymyxa]
MSMQYLISSDVMQQYVGQVVQFTAGNQHYTGLMTAFNKGTGMATFLIQGPSGQQYTMQFHRQDIIGMGPAVFTPPPSQQPSSQQPQYPSGGGQQIPWWIFGRAYTNHLGQIIITPGNR